MRHLLAAVWLLAAEPASADLWNDLGLSRFNYEAPSRPSPGSSGSASSAARSYRYVPPPDPKGPMRRLESRLTEKDVRDLKKHWIPLAPYVGASSGSSDDGVYWDSSSVDPACATQLFIGTTVACPSGFRRAEGRSDGYRWAIDNLMRAACIADRLRDERTADMSPEDLRFLGDQLGLALNGQTLEIVVPEQPRLSGKVQESFELALQRLIAAGKNVQETSQAVEAVEAEFERAGESAEKAVQLASKSLPEEPEREGHRMPPGLERGAPAQAPQEPGPGASTTPAPPPAPDFSAVATPQVQQELARVDAAEQEAARAREEAERAAERLAQAHESRSEAIREGKGAEENAIRYQVIILD